MHGEDVGIGFLVLSDQVAFGGVRAEAAGIDPCQIDGRLPVDDPFGELPAGTAGGRDAEGVALVQPEILESRRRPHDRVTVGRIGDRAVIDLLDADFGEGGYAGKRGLDMRHQPVELFLEKLILAVIRRAIDIADRRAGLIRAEDQPAGFLAHVPGAVGFAQHAHFRQPLLLALQDRRVRFGDDVLVLHRDHRDVDPDHLACLAGKIAGAGDHVIGGEDLLVRLHMPGPVRILVKRRDGGVAHDPGTPVARALGQRLGEVGGLDIAVIGMLDRAQNAVGFAERPNLLELFRRQEFHVDADGFCDAGIIKILIHPVLRHCQTDIGDLREADIEAGLRFQRAVEINRIFVKLADGIAHVEERQETCRMPCRAGCQFLPFDQDRVRPALLRQMVKRRYADHAAADHQCPCFGRHPCRLCNVSEPPASGASGDDEDSSPFAASPGPRPRVRQEGGGLSAH